jgi:hypothetical protein
MAAGYAFGAVFVSNESNRRRWLYGIGVGVTIFFVILRAANIYGDSSQWHSQSSGLLTFFSFLNCTKYPPSLLYLLMTLGPAFLILAVLDRGTPRWLSPICVFGRAPMFFYLLHLPLIHGLAVIYSWLNYGGATWWFVNDPEGSSRTALLPNGYGFGLPGVYAVWIVVVVALYPACRWFADIKRRRRDPWLSYL